MRPDSTPPKFPTNAPTITASDLASYFTEDCTTKLKENAKMLWQLFTDPASRFNIDMSSGLQDMIAGAMEGDWDDFKDFVAQNSDLIATAVTAIPGVNDLIGQLMEKVFRFLALMQLMMNTFVLILLKSLAQSIVLKINYKTTQLNDLRGHLIDLHNLVITFTGGDPLYEAYLKSLRDAYYLLLNARDDLRFVKDGLELKRNFRSAVFEKARKETEDAYMILNPSKSGKNPFISPFFDPKNKNARNKAAGQAASNFLTTTTGFPSQAQTSSFLKMGKRIREAASAMELYQKTVATINGMLAAFIAGPNLIMTSMGDVLFSAAADSITNMINILNQLVGNEDQKRGLYDFGEMRQELRINLPPTNVDYGKQPQPITISAYSFKWAAQVSLVISQMKLIPVKALNLASLAEADLVFFNSITAKLKAMDSIKGRRTTLEATDAQENPIAFAQQLLLMLLGAIKMVPQDKPPDKRKAQTKTWAELVKAQVDRVDMTLGREIGK